MRRPKKTEITPAVSAEGEGVGLDARIEEADLERAIGNRAILPDKLIEPLPVHHTLAIGIDIGAMAVAGQCAVNRHAEANGIALLRGAENEVEIAHGTGRLCCPHSY